MGVFLLKLYFLISILSPEIIPGSYRYPRIQSMRASAIAHPNVALIKYWGKTDTDRNLPAVGSLSVTLGALSTETTVEFDAALKQDVLVLNGSEQPLEQERLTACLDAFRALADCDEHATVTSSNDFPTGAGLASSASGYAALVVAVTTEEKKNITSRDGMAQSKFTSPFYEAWIRGHADNLETGVRRVRERVFSALAELSEHNCLKMHSVMMTTRPPLMYWSPVTLACMQKIRALRADGVPVFFTIDAGPQVKAVCLPDALSTVATALHKVPGVLRIIAGELGEGARVVAA